jgi:hypothetical protein
VEKSTPKFWATSIIFIRLPTINNWPIGENLPNLVTLQRMEKEPNREVCRHAWKRYKWLRDTAGKVHITYNKRNNGEPRVRKKLEDKNTEKEEIGK